MKPVWQESPASSGILPAYARWRKGQGQAALQAWYFTPPWGVKPRECGGFRNLFGLSFCRVPPGGHRFGIHGSAEYPFEPSGTSEVGHHSAREVGVFGQSLGSAGGLRVRNLIRSSFLRVPPGGLHVRVREMVRVTPRCRTGLSLCLELSMRASGEVSESQTFEARLSFESSWAM